MRVSLGVFLTSALLMVFLYIAFGVYGVVIAALIGLLMVTL